MCHLSKVKQFVNAVQKITAFLTRQKTRRLIFNDAVGDRGDVVAVNLDVPKVASGPYTLELDIRFDKRRRTIEIPITVVDTPPKESLEIPKDSLEKKYVDQVAKGDHVVHLFTEDRGAPTGISSTAFLRVQTADGKPDEITVAYSVGNQPTINKESDKLGLITVPLSVSGLSAPITIAGARPVGENEADGGVLDSGPMEMSATLYPNIVYSGLSLSVHTPIATNKCRIKVTIEQVSSGGPVYANLFHEGRLVQGASGFLSGQRAVMEIRPESTGLHRLQVSGAAIGAGDSVAVRHFYVLGPKQDPADGLRDIVSAFAGQNPEDKWAAAFLEMVLARGGFDLQRAAAFALSRLYSGHRHPPQLISSRLEDDKELTAFKSKFQRMMMVAIIALGLGVCLFIGLFALAAHKRQQRLSQMILEEDDESEPDETPRDWTSLTGYRSKGRVLLQGAILFFIVLGAFVAIALLVNTLTWRS